MPQTDGIYIDGLKYEHTVKFWDRFRCRKPIFIAIWAIIFLVELLVLAVIGYEVLNPPKDNCEVGEDCSDDFGLQVAFMVGLALVLVHCIVTGVMFCCGGAFCILPELIAWDY